MSGCQRTMLGDNRACYRPSSGEGGSYRFVVGLIRPENWTIYPTAEAFKLKIKHI